MKEILLFILIATTGSFLIKTIIKDLSLFRTWSVGSLVGLGYATFMSFVLSWMGLRITFLSVIAIILITLLLVLVFRFIINRNIYELFELKRFNPALTVFEKTTLLFVAVVCLSSFLFTIYFPVNVWDALALYDFRAKVIADIGYFVQISSSFDYFSHYPLFTSLTHSFVYLSGGSNPQFIYSIYLVLFAVIYYTFLKDNVSRTVALVSTFLMVTIPEIYEHSTIAYTNFPYTVFYVCGILFLNYSLVKRRPDYLFVSSIFIGFSTWIRSDLPFWLSSAVLVILYSVKIRKAWPVFIYFPIFLLIQQIWNAFASGMFGSDYSTSGQIISAGGSIFSQINIYRLYEVLIYLYLNVFTSWGVIALLFLVAIIWNIWNRVNIALPLIIVIILNIFGIVVGTYVFSFKVFEWKEIADSATRMAMFFPPLMLYYATLSFGQEFKKQK